MADLTLAQLLVPPTTDTIRERILGRLHRRGFPITDFESGAIVRTVVEACAEAIADFVAALIPRIAGGGFVDEADIEWLEVLAKQNFNLERLAASYTTQRLTLTVAAGQGPYTVAVGDLVAEAVSGNRYVLAEAGTLSSVAPVGLLFTAESPGAQYTDAAGQITDLVTGLEGVSVANAAPAFSAITHSGTGTGTVVPSGTATAAARFTLRVATSGQANAATFEFSRDGAAYEVGGVCSSSGVVIGSGITVTFSNGPSIPSFVTGDTYLLSAPGSPVVTQGRDEETAEELAARMIARWPALAEVPTAGKYELWARAASADVTKVTVREANSDATPGRVEIVIAGSVNPLAAAVGPVQAFIDERAGITEHPVVSSATVVDVHAAGSVHVNAQDLAGIQQQAQLAWQLYLASLPIGGTYRAAELAEILMDLGAVDFRDLRVGPLADVTYFANSAGASEVLQAPVATLTTQLTWLTV